MTGYTWGLNQGAVGGGVSGAISTAASKWGSSSFLLGSYTANYMNGAPGNYPGVWNTTGTPIGQSSGMEYDAWTMEMWVNFTGNGNYTAQGYYGNLVFDYEFGYFINAGGSNSTPSGSCPGWCLRYLAPNSGPSTFVFASNQQYVTLGTWNTSSYPLNTWHYISVSMSGGIIYWFIDGVLISTNNTANVPGWRTPDFSGINFGQALSQSGTQSMTGRCYVNEFLLTLGVNRYTTAYTPPSGPYNASADTFASKVYIYSSFDGATNGATTYTDQTTNIPWVRPGANTSQAAEGVKAKAVSPTTVQDKIAIKAKSISPPTVSDKDAQKATIQTRRTVPGMQTNLPSNLTTLPLDPTPTFAFDAMPVETNDFMYYFYDPAPYIPTVSNQAAMYTWKYGFNNQQLPLQYPVTPYFLAGTVTLNGIPMQGAIIQIEGANQELGSIYASDPQVSDVNGNYIFHNVPNLLYSLRCTAPESYGLGDQIWKDIAPTPYAISLTGSMHTDTVNNVVTSTVNIINGYGPFTIVQTGGTLPGGTTLAIVGTNVQVQGATTFFSTSYFFSANIIDALGNATPFNFQITPAGTNSLGLFQMYEGAGMTFWKEALNTWIDFEVPGNLLSSTASVGDFSNFTYWVVDKGNDLGVANGPNATLGANASPWTTNVSTSLQSNNGGGAFRSNAQVKFGAYSGQLVGTTGSPYAFYKGVNSNFQLDFTIDMFIYITAYPGSGTYGYLANNDDTGITANRGWRFAVDNTGTLILAVTGSNGTTYQATSGTTKIPLNAWTHVVGVRHGQSLIVFIGGNAYPATNVIPVGMPLNFNAAMNQIPFGCCINARAGTGNMSYYMDDVVVVNGGAMYITSFTPRTLPFNPLISRY